MSDLSILIDRLLLPYNKQHHLSMIEKFIPNSLHRQLGLLCLSSVAPLQI